MIKKLFVLYFFYVFVTYLLKKINYMQLLDRSRRVRSPLQCLYNALRPTALLQRCRAAVLCARVARNFAIFTR